MRDGVRMDANGENKLGNISHNSLQYHCANFFAGWLQRVIQEE